MGRTKSNAARGSDAERFLISQMYQCQEYLATCSFAPGFNATQEQFEEIAWPLLQKKDRLRTLSSGKDGPSLGMLEFGSPPAETQPNKRPRLDESRTPPAGTSGASDTSIDETRPLSTSTQAEPSTLQQLLQSQSRQETQDPVTKLMGPPPQSTPPNQAFKAPPQPLQHMHQLLQLLKHQQRHLQTRGGPPPAQVTPRQVQPEGGVSLAGQSDPQLQQFQALMYASAAPSGGGEAEPPKLVDAFQALIKAKEASIYLGEAPVNESQDYQKSAQLHQLQRIIPQLTPATLSSWVGGLEASKGPAFREHVSVHG